MLDFTSSARMTLGVEIELQLIDRESRDLTPRATEVLEQLGDTGGRIKPEIFRAMLEISTGICDRVQEVRADLEAAVLNLRAVCQPLGVEIATAGSHPFARHRERLIYPAERYQYLIDRNRWVAQRLMIFGIHLHLGMRDGDHAIAMMNGMSAYLPYALAVSASSPYWQGSDTGLASSRTTIFEALPTGGHPCLFRDWADFDAFYGAAIRSRAIRSAKDIWWDIRPSPEFGTLEIRACDGLPTLSEAISVVAFLRCLALHLDERYRAGEPFLPQPYWILRENKWRASRWGLAAEIVLDEAGHTAPLVSEMEKLLEVLEPCAVQSGCTAELAALRGTMNEGVSYQRQRRVFEESGDLRVVTDTLIEEFRSDRPHR